MARETQTVVILLSSGRGSGGVALFSDATAAFDVALPSVLP